MKSLFLRLGLIAVVAGGIFGYRAYDRAANYQQVTATVTGVEEVCHLTKKEGRTRWVSDAGPCDEVEIVNKTHPEYLDYKLVRTTTVAYRYRSPVDGEYYTASHQQRHHKNGGAIGAGDDLVILAHTTRPEETDKY